jgi:hypothetical protein
MTVGCVERKKNKRVLAIAEIAITEIVEIICSDFPVTE